MLDEVRERQVLRGMEGEYQKMHKVRQEIRTYGALHICVCCGVRFLRLTARLTKHSLGHGGGGGFSIWADRFEIAIK